MAGVYLQGVAYYLPQRQETAGHLQSYCKLYIAHFTGHTFHFTALHTTYCLTRWSSSVDIRTSWCDNSTNLVKSIHFPTVTLLSQMKSQSKQYSVKTIIEIQMLLLCAHFNILQGSSVQSYGNFPSSKSQPNQTMCTAGQRGTLGMLF